MKQIHKFGILIISILLFSCNEEIETSSSILAEEGKSNRLIFNSRAEFSLVMEDVLNSEKDQSTLFRQKLSKTPNFKSIQRLLENPDSRLEKVISGRLFTEDLNEMADSISDLIPDIQFREFWNDNLEIEINDTIYKITPHGTFFSGKDNYNRLVAAIEKYNPNIPPNPNGRIESNEPRLAEIESDIFLYDSFGNEVLSTNQLTFNNSNTMYQPNYVSPIYPYALPLADYDKFTVYNYGAKTDIGKIIEGIFGGNTSFDQQYNSNYRLRVKLYAFDYLFYKSIGLNAKVQKKGWTGIWATHNDSKAEKLILGWDNILFNMNIPYAMPIAYQSFPAKGVGKELMKFVNFELPTGTLTDVTIPFFKKEPITYSDLEKSLSGLIKSSFSTITKNVWNEAEQYFANSSYEIKKEEVKAWRKVFPDKFKVMLSRKEAVLTNANEIHLVIDRHFSISYKQTGIDQNYAEKVLKPTFDESKKKLYEIDGASIYGAAIFKGQLKGIRIIKELND